MAKLQAGKHNVSVMGAGITLSKSGTIGITFRFRSDDGEIDCTRWVTDRTRQYVLRDLETLGFTAEMLEDAANLDRIGEITFGNECEIVVEDEEYNGNWVPKVKWINALNGGGRANPDTTAKIQSILLGRAVSAAPKPAAQSKEHSKSEIDSSDIPF